MNKQGKEGARESMKDWEKRRRKRVAVRKKREMRREVRGRRL